MSFIGEAIATAAIDVLFSKLASPELLQFASREKIRADLKEWEKILLKIHAVLDDAEDKQVKNRPVKIWLSELKNLAYDVEDILDEFATEALRRTLVDQSQASTSKVQKFIPSCLIGLSPRSIKSGNQMASQIKEITTRLEEITTQRDNFNLIENSGGRRPYRVEYRRWPETSVSDPHIYGRKEDKEAILELLLKDESTDGNFSVISIVGMGGMGKTTLAQLAYNDVKVDAFFDVKAWACVSDDFNVIDITKAILQSVAPQAQAGDYNDLDKLQVALKKELSGKKFFIVLDDIWNENYDAWTLLCRPFQDGSSRSKILVTTRNLSVSLVVRALQTHKLNKLSKDDCLSVFTQHSLGKIDFGERQDLEEIGKKIIEKCDGLPLAAKTLGGLLCGKDSCKEWEDVLDSKIWNLPEAKSGILPALIVSYHYLPSHLKRCFGYCSIFPKDYKFNKEDIILLWMAEGFLQKDSSENKEDLGKEYFEDLLSRSFFQKSSSNASSFVMHDLIHDLAQWAAEDICFMIENLQKGEKQWKISEHHRHLSCLIGNSLNYGIFKKSGALNEMKSIRTFLVLSPYSLLFDDSNHLLLMLLQLKRLRVLYLNGYSIYELPNTIGDMKLLHLLDLSNTAIELLPDSINKLYNLESLVLKNCRHLKRLCSDMGNLIKLRHINVSGVDRLEAMPLRIGKSTSLRTLQRFVVGKDMSSGLKELKDLKHLQERLHISGLENVNDFVDAENANLNGKDGLKDLQLEWTCSNDGSNEKEIAAEVLEKLLPSQKLESLCIKGYGGAQFPQWLGDSSLSSLVTLKFENCKNCASFPSIGQLPSLKKLVIRNMDGIERLGPELYGHGYSTVAAPFQLLEEFEIHNLQEWRDWSPCGSGRNVEAFPRLRQLSIVDCPKLLGKLPEHLTSLENLYISNCNALQSLPTAWMDSSNTSLKNLSIKYCNSLTCIARVHLPPNLKLLKILFCSNLVTLLDDEPVSGSCKNTSCLEHLKISYCPSLTSLWSKGNELPDTLQKIEFSRCNNITTLASTGNLPKALRYLSIERCSKLESIAKGFHDNMKLEELNIEYCEKLETLPSGINNLISLKKLEIRGCPAMVSIPEGGLPTSLTSLVIVSKICKSLFEWGLHRLTSLEVLDIDGGCPDVMSFPQEETGMILPTSLTTLHIWDFWNLERLSSIAQNLTCLENLSLYNCPKLEYFPDDGLPKSLKQLRILYCPLLEARCKEGEGLYWPMIAHITEHVFYT